MKRLILSLALVLVMAGISQGAFKETITVSSTAIGPTIATIAQPNFTAKFAFCTVETNSIRFFYDGSTPTASVGHLVEPSTWFILTGDANVKALKMIRVTSDAPVTCTYE